MNYVVQDSRIMNWIAYPLVRIVVCFILGILISQNFESFPLFSFLIIVLVIFTVVMLLHKSTKDTLTNTCSFLIFTLFIGCGVVRGLLEFPSNIKTHYIHSLSEGNNVIVGQVVEDIQKRKASYSTRLKVMQVGDSSTQGDLLLYFNKRDSLLQYEIGDIIAISGKASEIQQTKNPKSFNYRKFLARKGIHRQVFLKVGKHRLVRKDRIWLPQHYANIARKWALGILEKRISNREEYAIAAAMVLGDKTNISDKLQVAFSDTGAVHVLAVSGLHVGIVLMLFNFLFRRINKKSTNKSKLVKMVVMSTVVILYAMITGASPAVVRATIMFTTILFGKLYFDDVNIYNILALSALLILIYDPNYLFHLGFIFSYLALISIVFFQPMILRQSERIYSTKSRLGYNVIQLVTVSIAAQILIFPMSVFYFHKFPIYFIISGVIAVAMAPFLLGTGLLSISLDGIPLLGDIVTMIFERLLWVFLEVIYLIQSLPFNSIRNMWISQSSMILQYVVILCTMYIISRKKTGYQEFLNPQNFDRNVAGVLIFLSLFGLLVNSSFFDYRTKNHKELIFYDHRGSTLIDIFDGDQLYTISSPGLSESNEMYTCRDYRIYNGNPNQQELKLDRPIISSSFISDGKGLVQFGNTIILFVNMVDIKASIPTRSDVLMVSHGTENLPYKFLDRHVTKLVVLDQSLAYKITNQWKKECFKRGIAYYLIREKGPLRMKLKED